MFLNNYFSQTQNNKKVCFVGIELLCFILLPNLFATDIEKTATSDKTIPSEKGSTFQAVHSDEPSYKELWAGRTKTLNDAYFTLDYPAEWMEFTYKSPGVDYVLNATGVGIPAKYNGAGVLGAVYIWRQSAEIEKDVVQAVMELPNRAGHALMSYVEDFQNDQIKGKLIISYFGKHFAGKNGIRYDFVTYSKKRDQYYGFTMLLQYRQKDEDFGKKYNTQAYFEELINHLNIKE